MTVCHLVVWHRMLISSVQIMLMRTPSPQHPQTTRRLQAPRGPTGQTHPIPTQSQRKTDHTQYLRLMKKLTTDPPCLLICLNHPQKWQKKKTFRWGTGKSRGQIPRPVLGRDTMPGHSLPPLTKCSQCCHPSPQNQSPRQCHHPKSQH